MSLFVAAASTVAVYAGRESGMQHVFKVTHSGSGGDAELPAKLSHGGGGRALVFAADCEEEALAWINVGLPTFFIHSRLYCFTFLIQ